MYIYVTSNVLYRSSSSANVCNLTGDFEYHEKLGMHSPGPAPALIPTPSSQNPKP